MKSLGLLSAAAGAVLLGLTAAASAAPVGTGLPSLSTLSLTGSGVEPVNYWHHRRCHWVRHRGHMHRHCHR